jgi:DNA polymerase-3 subunit beta
VIRQPPCSRGRERGTGSSAECQNGLDRLRIDRLVGGRWPRYNHPKEQEMVQVTTQMKVTCTQESLARGLSIVNRAVAARSTLPITQHILLTTEDARLKLCATNTEITLSCWLDARVEAQGSVTLPARFLTPFVDSLPNDRLELTLQPRGRQVKIQCGRNQATIGGLDADDFPPVPVVEGDATIRLEPAALRKALSQVVFAAATDDSRPVLTGVHIRVEQHEAKLAAADGFRLAVHTLPLAEPASTAFEVIIPARALAELNRLLGDQEQPVQMTLNANRSAVLFRLKDVEMVAQLLNQGAFPNYSQLIPQSYTTRAVVSVPEFLRETRIASIFSREGSGIVRLQVTPGQELTPGQLQVSARADEVGDNQGEIDAAVDGDAAKIAFNSKYLQEVLSVLDSGQVALETTSPSSPGVLRPVGADNYVHVVMPMFVQW